MRQKAASAQGHGRFRGFAILRGILRRIPRGPCLAILRGRPRWTLRYGCRRSRAQGVRADCPAANAGLPHKALPAGFDEVAVSPPRHARPLTTAAGLGYWLGWFTCTCTSGIGWADALTTRLASYQLNTLEKVPRGPQGICKQHVHFHKSGFGAAHCLGRACARKPRPGLAASCACPLGVRAVSPFEEVSV